MAPAHGTQHSTILKAFFMFGILLLVLGVDGADDKVRRRARKQESSSRSKDQKTGAVLDRVPRRVMDCVKLVYDTDTTTPQAVLYDPSLNSISPWNYSYIRDVDLIPEVIPQANCLKEGCLDVNGEEDMNFISKPILRQIMVLRRVYQKSRIVLKMEKKIISVGCTCVRPVVLSQD
ncbi:interleukin 17a/f3 [Brienomyrus brachyistius]|uniref:interleukin 17a/f3 n=1 Tax=Brienomyrus brachyistius TaxID=42636 RepID=UPI0020B33826|nr:interleukin 17a/f3 [Brienomyrus brachyistius]